MDKKIKGVFGAAAILGMISSDIGATAHRRSTHQPSEPSDFAKRSNEFKALCRPRLVYRSGRPYIKPRPNKTRMTI